MSKKFEQDFADVFRYFDCQGESKVEKSKVDRNRV